jgi:hypothetical protein
LNERFEQYINGKRENLHSNFTLRLKKILWEARSTPTLISMTFCQFFKQTVPKVCISRIRQVMYFLSAILQKLHFFKLCSILLSVKLFLSIIQVLQITIRQARFVCCLSIFTKYYFLKISVCICEHILGDFFSANPF